MSATEWFVIDTRTNVIVNCIYTADDREPSLDFGWTEPEFLRVDKNPTREQRESYRFWYERP